MRRSSKLQTLLKKGRLGIRNASATTYHKIGAILVLRQNLKMRNAPFDDIFPQDSDATSEL